MARAPGTAAERDRQIIEVIRSLGPGEVVSYGDIADDAGHSGRARLVGRLLATSGDADDLPWWRVVDASGRLVPGHEVEQASRLRAEGVEVHDGRVRRARTGRFSPGRP
jgi:methylated-DNA-protein-cysteine methyltransferase related protein